MASEVQICNLALTKIGEDQISSLTDNSKAARLCNLHYEPLRDAVLRGHLWNFAIKRVILALSTNTPAFDYAYQHALPVDYLRAFDVNLISAAEWKIENGFLLSDSDEVTLKYIARITDPDLFDVLFRDCLAARIAAELAQPITDDKKLTEQMFSIYNGKIAEARSMDAMEGTPENITADAWLDSRLGYVSSYNG